MTETLVLLSSIVLQFIAAFLALRLIPLTGRRAAWSCIAAAALLMGLRRCLTLYRIVIEGSPSPLDISTEVVGLAISASMLAGIAWIAPLFRSIRRSEEELRESKEHYRMVVEFASDCIYWMGPRGEIRYVCPACSRFTGYSAEELYASPDLFERMVHPEDRAAWERHKAEITDDGSHAPVEFRVITKTGETRWISHVCRRVFDEAGRLAGVRGSNRDITERRLAEEALRRSEASLAQAQRIAHLGNWEWEEKTDGLRWSEEINCIFGLTQGSSEGPYRAFLDRVHPEDRQLVEDAVARALHREAPYTVYHRVVRPDGEVRVVHEQGEVDFDAAGNPVRMFGTVHDITEEKRAEEEAQLRRQQLEQADKMVTLGILVSGVAHEINNPNHAIMTDASSLREAWQSIVPILDRFHEEYGEFVVGGYEYSTHRDQIPAMFGGVLDSSRRIQRIVQELRDFARHSPADQMGVVDINSVLRSANTLLSNMVAKATEHYVVRYTPNLPKCFANFQRIEQVIINLVQNACQALRDRQAAITVTTGHDPATRTVFVRVQDEGVGIPPENLKHVIDPFFTTKRDSGGTGLGLWISSSIAHEHGGTLEFSSIEGEGTTATLLLPIKRADITESQSGPEAKG